MGVKINKKSSPFPPPQMTLLSPQNIVNKNANAALNSMQVIFCYHSNILMNITTQRIEKNYMLLFAEFR